MVTISDTLSGNGSGPAVGVRPGIDLTTTYLGLSLRNPLVASPSPATSTVNRVKALADAGVGAVVLPSLYEEQVIAEELREIGFTEPYEDAHGEAQGYFPVVSGNQLPGATWRYLRLVEEAVAAVDIPVIASLNGSSLGGWTDFARPDGGCRRGRARAQHLLRARRPAHLGARGRGPARRDPSSGQGRGRRSRSR